MRITVLGTGYVGLVTGVCLSDTGRFVTCVDIDPAKVEMLTQGKSPIYESGLDELLAANIQAGRLDFTTDLPGAIEAGDIIFIAVGTPPLPDGSVDMSQVDAVAEAIAEHAADPKVVVMKSTVPVGTARRVQEYLSANARVPIDYVSNPEFLKEGNALEDFTKPDRVVIGAENPQAGKAVGRLYAPYMRQSQRVIYTDPATAEMAKYASNSMLAARISFMNEIAQLCDHYGANVDDVRRCVGSDRRIGSAFLFPGLGYGGFCFPKDVQALVQLGTNAGCDMRLARATHEANLSQPEYFKRLIDRVLGQDLEGTRLAVWGLAYKARTDDVRMSPALSVVKWLTQAGADVCVHDPQAMGKAAEQLDGKVCYCKEMYETCRGAEALLVMTDWQEFRSPDIDLVRSLLARPVILDGRNLYDPADLAEAGFAYYSIGRPGVPGAAPNLAAGKSLHPENPAEPESLQ